MFAQGRPAPIVCPSSPAAEVERVLGVANGIIDADNKGDLERVLGFYASDVLMMPPNEEPVSGLAAIRPRYEGLFKNFTPAIVPRVDEVCVTGVRAFVRGRNGGRLASRSGGADLVLDDVYVMLLRREADGRWLITHLIWHRAGPAKEGSRGM